MADDQQNQYGEQPLSGEQSTSGAPGQQLGRPASPVESASATTSPDNKSGAAVYVIVGAVLAVFVALGLAVGSVVGSIAASYSSPGGSLGGSLSDDDLDELEELLRDLEGDSGSGSGNSDSIDNLPDSLGGGNTLSGTTELDEDTVMSYDYYCFDYSVGDFVYAADYDGAQATVSTFVKSLVEADSSATSTLRSHVRAAAQATDAEARATELELAAQACADAHSSLAALAVPTAADISGSHAEDIAEELEEAYEDTAERWADLASIVEVMKSPAGHKAAEIAELDEDAGNVTPIAIDLTHALSDSANYK